MHRDAPHHSACECTKPLGTWDCYGGQIVTRTFLIRILFDIRRFMEPITIVFGRKNSTTRCANLQSIQHLMNMAVIDVWFGATCIYTKIEFSETQKYSDLNPDTQIPSHSLPVFRPLRGRSSPRCTPGEAAIRSQNDAANNWASKRDLRNSLNKIPLKDLEKFTRPLSWEGTECARAFHPAMVHATLKPLCTAC